MKRHKWAVAFTACLLAFTVFISLDTFVLSSAYQTDATEINLTSIKSAAEAETKPEVSVEKDDDGNKAESDSASDPSSDSSADQDGETGSSGNKPSSDDDETTDVSAGSGDASESENQTDGDSEDSDSSHHRKKPGSGTGGPGSGKGGPGSSSGSSDSSESDSDSSSGSPGKGGFGGHGGGKTSTATTTTMKDFDEEEAAASAAEVTTENTESNVDYQDENVKITYTQYTTNNTTIHVADVQLTSAEHLKTAFANDTYGKNVTQATSDIAAANNAILAINGDYYGVQEKGYVIRNGVLYREEAGVNDVLCIYGDGSMKVVDPSTVTAQELLEQGVWQAFSFGPGLLDDGEIPISLDTEVGKARASNPRTAIGIIDDLHYVFVVSDGRSDESEGLSLYELATFMQQLGVKIAYNLDGGGSSTMYFNGDVVNNPTSGFKDDERKVSDIIYIS